MKNKSTFTYYILLTSFFLLISSCVSTPNYNSAKKYHDSDVSNYADHIITNCKLPDGKIANVYVFNNVTDGVYLQNLQIRKYDSEYKEFVRKKERELGHPQYITEAIVFGNILANLHWMPTGPQSSFWKLESQIYEKYGKDQYLKICKSLNVISYFKVEDLGELSPYMTIKSYAQACCEDSDGVYLLTIAPPERMNGLKGMKSEIKKHKGQLAYEVAFAPRKIQSFIQLPKNTPAKILPTTINEIPDSDLTFEPSIPTTSTSYYYDEILAYQLQWLAVKVACKGTYDMAYCGDFESPNPKNFYSTKFIKPYLARNDGSAQRGTSLFEGICFDYADFALHECITDKNLYKSIKNIFMAGTFDNCNDIILYRIANSFENSDMKINNTPVVIYSHQHTQAHRNSTHHAWVWLQTNDGTVYWIDPTYTDNTGHPVYGIVRGGREVELPPDPSLCIY